MNQEGNLSFMGVGSQSSVPAEVLFEQGIKSIWEDEYDSQLQMVYLEAIVKSNRKVPEEYADKVVQILKEMGAFYVMNDEYMSHHFTGAIRNFKYGVYHSGGEYCKYFKRLVIPLRYLDGTIFGFCGYSDGSSEGEDPNGIDHVKYLYPTKDQFDKAKYMFIERAELAKAIEDEYVMITDGLFDKISLQAQGYNATSLCGSALTEFHKLYLKPIKHKIVLPDNDKAGTAMANRCKREMKGTVQFKQGSEWDVDDWLKTGDGRKQLKKMFEQSKREGFIRDLVAKMEKPVRVAGVSESDNQTQQEDTTR